MLFDVYELCKSCRYKAQACKASLVLLQEHELGSRVLETGSSGGILEAPTSDLNRWKAEGDSGKGIAKKASSSLPTDIMACPNQGRQNNVLRQFPEAS